MIGTVLDANETALGKATLEKITSEKISITGQNTMSDYLTLLHTGLGVEQILIQGERTENGLSEVLKQIDELPQTYIERHNTIPIIARIKRFDPTQLYNCEEQNTITQSILQAVSKSQSFLNNIQEKQNNNFNEIFNTEKTFYNPQNALLVGAGGIGTYVAIELALRNIPNLTIIDDDIIEETNLNRQLLYAQNIGDKKAEVLSKKVKQLGAEKTRGIIERIESISKIEQHLNHNKYDVVYCATDNFESRYALSKACKNTQTMLLEGGCDTSVAVTAHYIPNRTQTTHETRRYTDFMNRKKIAVENSCARKANPSVIIPNVIAATMMVGLTYHQLTNKEHLQDEILYYNPENKKPFEVLKPC